jgi:hypothetical protein
LYELEFNQSPDGLSLTFGKNVYLVGRKQSMFGKNIIITDNTDWLTGDITSKQILPADRSRTGSASAKTTSWLARARSGTGRTAKSGVIFLPVSWR